MNDPERQEQLEARRLADALDAVEEGRDPNVDPREDPELSSLLATAEAVSTTWRATAPEPARAARLRSLLLRSTRRAGERRPVRPTKVVPLYRRWSVLSPLASAAAAAAVTFAITTLVASDAPTPGAQPSFASTRAAAGPGETARHPLLNSAGPEQLPDTESSTLQPEPPAENLTSEALVQDLLVQDLRRIEAALQEIRALAERGEPVDAKLLRTITEGTARVASQIDTAPESVPVSTVATYFHYVSPAREILSSAQVAEGDERALDTARDATEDGLVVAVRYFTADNSE